MLKMRSGSVGTFERQLRAKISRLDFEGCKTLLKNDFAVHGDVFSPILIGICHEKALWKTLALKFDIDIEENWSEKELKKAISLKDENLLNTGCMSKAGIKDGLAKVVVDRIFDQFMELFVEYGYHIDAMDFSSQTALHHAIRYGFSSMVRLLIELGADVNIKALISSWIRVKLPAFYHSLYTLDTKVTSAFLISCDNASLSMKLGNIEDFVYLPKNVPESIVKCLQKIDEVTPLSFLLIILIIKSYGNPNIDSQRLSEMVNIGESFTALLQRYQIHFKTPEPLLDFYANSMAFAKMSHHGYCKDKFCLQLVNSLFNVQIDKPE